MAADCDNALGLYLSVPFCRSKCTYCNFASGVYPASEHGRYVDRLVDDLHNAGGWAARMGVELPRAVDTIYLGGGTPSLLEPELIARLFAAIRNEFDVETGAEITMECAPGQIGDEALDAMVQAGVNRVSLGVQSFVDREAAVSGRLHKRETVLADLLRLRAAGIDNLNLDLIAGLAGQTFASWEESLRTLIETGVPHASVYLFEVDEDSRLGRERLAQGSRYFANLVPSDDAMATMYTAAIEQLCRAGLAQYEISNFAREGHASRHNLRYWSRRPYLGVGLDASSMLRAPRRLDSRECGGDLPRVLRTTATSDLKAYLEGGEIESQWVSPVDQHEEAWFLGLRRNCGARVGEIEREFGGRLVAGALDAVQRLAKDGLLECDGEIVRLSARGRLLSNEVFQEFLAVETAGAR